jgi:hypothetical protein
VRGGDAGVVVAGVVVVGAPVDVDDDVDDVVIVAVAVVDVLDGVVAGTPAPPASSSL